MRHAVLIGAICTVGITACSEETGPNISGIDPLSVVEVSVSPSLDTLFVADTLRPTDVRQMTAAVLTRAGLSTGAKVVWASSNPDVAEVTADGIVVPTGYGTTTITASATKVGKATIVVMPAARTIVVTPGADTIFVDDPIATRDTVRFIARAFDDEGHLISGVAFTWNSAATNMATVSGFGTAVARGLGITTLTARSGEMAGTANVRVASMVKAVQLAVPVTTVLVRDTLQLTATALGYDDKPMAGRTFTFTSSNPGVATVNNNGRAVFTGPGTVTFTAKSAFTTSTVVVNALEREFLSVDAGTDVTCGFTNLGRGYCWGDGSLGKLASAADSVCFDENEDTSPCTLSPKRFAAPDLNFTAVASGGTSGCGITIDKLIYCWGDNSVGQIGNGRKGAGGQPMLATVAQLRFDSITVGGEHACALSTTRQPYCWGLDTLGQLGDDRTVNSTTPIPVKTALPFSTISAGTWHTCGISSGRAYCWGSDSTGQLGDGSVGGFSDVPVAVASAETFVAISTGMWHTCGLTSNGNAVCWGNGSGTPAIVSGGPFARIAAGDTHTCAITAAGGASCWGSGDWGENGTTTTLTTPVALTGGILFKSITAGARHSCGVATDGETYCWGSNVFGALGNELQANFRTTPQKVAVPR
jgi:alpha-tubulin suppressor-like RCC1 family protein